jgi:hypothetical protein
MLASHPTFSDTNLEEIAVYISLEVCRAIHKIFDAHGIGTYQVSTFHKPTLKVVGTKILQSAAADFNERVA